MRVKLEHPLYTVPETLALIKIGLTKFYAEVAAGRIYTVKAGHRTLVPAEAIYEWIDSLPKSQAKNECS